MSVAIDKLLLIILGLIVLVVALVFYFGYIRPEITNCEICRNFFIRWCAKCAVNEYSSEISLPADICECSVKCGLISSCTNCRDLESECSKYINYTSS